MLIGLCGPNFAGNTQVAQYLVEELGFVSVPNISTLNLIQDASKNKSKHMNGFYDSTKLPSQKLVSQCWKKSVNIVIQRCEHNIEKLESLLKRPYFLLVYVDAPLAHRYANACRMFNERSKEIPLSTFVQYDDIMRFGYQIHPKNRSQLEPSTKIVDTTHLQDMQEWKVIEEQVETYDNDEKSEHSNLHQPVTSEVLDEKIFAPYRVLESWSLITIENTFQEREERLRDYLREIDFFNPEYLRPKWDSYFMSLSWLASQRTNCMKRRVGCVIVCASNRVVATGYNGTPAGTKNCNDGGCGRCCSVKFSKGKGLDLCLCLHAEENAIIEAGRERCTNATLYTTLYPCVLCSRKIVQAGIKRVVYNESYAMDNQAGRLLEEGGVIISKQEKKQFHRKRY